MLRSNDFFLERDGWEDKLESIILLLAGVQPHGMGDQPAA
jgi:hypothetical protein